MKALVIEDSPEVVEAVSLCLELRWSGLTVISTAEGAKGVELAGKEAPDVVILDVNLPDMSGFDVLRQIRAFSDVPVVVLTVRGTSVDVVKGLELGADDYITKPFSYLELLARVKTVLRRTSMPELKGDQKTLEAGDIHIDLAAHQVRRDGQVIKLTPIEYGLLTHLVRNEGHVLSHQALLEKVWGEEFTDATDYIKKYMHRLRQKLGDDTNSPRIILNERGIGYKFVRPS